MKIIKQPVNFSQGEPSSFITIGNKTIPIMLDTGAASQYLVLSKHALKGVKVNYTGRTTCFRALDRRYCMKKFIIHTVKIGKFVLHDIPGLEMQHLWDAGTKGFIETEASKNGIIGLALMRRFNVLFGFKDHEIIFMPQHITPNHLNLNQCHKITMNLRHGMMVNFSINHSNLRMVIDSGANVSIIKSSVASHHYYSCDKEHQQDFQNCHVNKISLFADQKTQDFYLKDYELPFDGFIGSDYLREHDLFMDSYNNTVYFC